MVNYLLLYSGGSMPETEADQKAVMEAWGAWMGALGPAMVDSGNPFTPQVKTIDVDGSVNDGPAGRASGYSVIKADSMDAAVKMAQDCPVLQGGGRIMVFETFDVM